MKRILIILIAVFLIITLAGVWFYYRPVPLRLEYLNEFETPVKVQIRNYTGDALEPFISRDGKYLFFNNSENLMVNTDIFYAERIGTNSFDFKGEVLGINSPKFEAVPSMDVFSNFFYTSLKTFSPTSKIQSLITVYTGKFSNGLVDYDHEIFGNFFPKELGWVVTDSEISPDGSRIYYSKAFFDNFELPMKKSDLGSAILKDKRFVEYADNEKIFEHINTKDCLEYSPSITADGLEIFFVRHMTPGCSFFSQDKYQILHSKRGDRGGQFTKPRLIKSIATDSNCAGQIGAPSISYDGQTLYYHCQEGNRFVVYSVKRKPE